MNLRWSFRDQRRLGNTWEDARGRRMMAAWACGCRRSTSTCKQSGGRAGSSFQRSFARCDRCGGRPLCRRMSTVAQNDGVMCVRMPQARIHLRVGISAAYQPDHRSSLHARFNCNSNHTCSSFNRHSCVRVSSTQVEWVCIAGVTMCDRRSA